MKRKVALIALGLALVIAMALPLYERFFGRKRLRFPYLARSIPAATYAALAAKPGWAKAELKVAPDVTLRGLVRRPSSKDKPWVLFYPGNDESQLERGQGFLMRLGGDADLGLAVFGYRGYDASDGKSELDGIRADAPQLLAELCKAEGIEPAQVHLAGFSIGGHFAVQAARGAAERGQRAATLTLLAPVNDIVMYHPSRFEKLSAGEDYQTAPYLAGVPAPVLVLQGAADQTLDGASQGSAIARALGDRAKYVEFAGVGHVPLLSHEPALAAERDFMKQHSADDGSLPRPGKP
jgi:pimeloyl-ACP methyl ester carboxylesterase